MGRHDQRIQPRHMTCSNCIVGFCENCVDVFRYLAGNTDPICQCKRRGHDGEPVNNQIKDPETGTVYGPGLSVDIDGKVTYDD